MVEDGGEHLQAATAVGMGRRELSHRDDGIPPRSASFRWAERISQAVRAPPDARLLGHVAVPPHGHELAARRRSSPWGNRTRSSATASRASSARSSIWPSRFPALGAPQPDISSAEEGQRRSAEEDPPHPGVASRSAHQHRVRRVPAIDAQTRLLLRRLGILGDTKSATREEP